MRQVGGTPTFSEERLNLLAMIERLTGTAVCHLTGRLGVRAGRNTMIHSRVSFSTTSKVGNTDSR